MAVKKVGALIKEARTKAGLSQEALAKLVDGLSASELGKVERGEKDLTNEELKGIAKATGVTQKSLLEAPKNLKAASSSAAKKAAGTGKKTETGSAAKKTSGTGKKTGSAAKKTGDSEKLTAAEKKFLQLYRAADADSRKAAEKLLKGEKDGLLEMFLGGAGGTVADLLSGLLKK